MSGAAAGAGGRNCGVEGGAEQHKGEGRWGRGLAVFVPDPSFFPTFLPHLAFPSSPCSHFLAGVLGSPPSNDLYFCTSPSLAPPHTSDIPFSLPDLSRSLPLIWLHLSRCLSPCVRLPCLNHIFPLSCFSFHVSLARCPVTVASTGTPGVPGVQAREVPAHDRGEASGPVPRRGLIRGGGAQGSKIPLRAPQGPG